MTLFYAGIALFNPLHEIAALSRRTAWQLASHAVALVAIVAAILWFGTLSRELLYALGRHFRRPRARPCPVRLDRARRASRDDDRGPLRR